MDGEEEFGKEDFWLADPTDDPTPSEPVGIWISDPSPVPNDTAPDTLCVSCMRHPSGYVDRPDPNCKFCGGSGLKRGLVQVETETSVQINLDLATPGADPEHSGAQAQQLFWNQSKI